MGIRFTTWTLDLLQTEKEPQWGSMSTFDTIVLTVLTDKGASLLLHHMGFIHKTFHNCIFGNVWGSTVDGSADPLRLLFLLFQSAVFRLVSRTVSRLLWWRWWGCEQPEPIVHDLPPFVS